MSRVFVEFDSSVDPIGWAARNARDEVPDRLPYGVQRLAEHGFELDVRAQPAHGRAVERVARSARHRGGGWEWVDGAISNRDRARREADAVLCWDERTAVPEGVLRRRSDPPLVTGLTWLADDPAPPGPLLWAARRALRSAAAVFSHSNAQMDRLCERFRVPAERLHFLPFGVDDEFFVPAGDPADPGQGGGVVVGVGDDQDRDHALLMAAVRLAQRRHPGLRLELGTTLPTTMPADLGVLHARRLGPAVRGLYARATVVAVCCRPNLHGSGLSVLMEAAASGRPVVVSDTIGVRDYVTPETGILVPPNDPEAFAAALSELLDDPQRCREMGRAARRFVQAEHSTVRQAEHLAAVLRSVL